MLKQVKEPISRLKKLNKPIRNWHIQQRKEYSSAILKGLKDHRRKLSLMIAEKFQGGMHVMVFMQHLTTFMCCQSRGK